uniref:CHCH domain-containing protein n=1 Tax=Panagrellus redivivus TaxID=6233 RepID=A0A7E4VCE6_PANRE
MASTPSGSASKHQQIELSEAEFFEPIKDEYIKSLSNLTMAELDDGYNPGPQNPDGSVNFTCHCVGHLVASPCGAEFREAATCQKSHKEEDFEAGACAEEFMSFMKCVMKTECFKARGNDEEDKKTE